MFFYNISYEIMVYYESNQNECQYSILAHDSMNQAQNLTFYWKEVDGAINLFDHIIDNAIKFCTKLFFIIWSLWCNIDYDKITNSSFKGK